MSKRSIIVGVAAIAVVALGLRIYVSSLVEARMQTPAPEQANSDGEHADLRAMVGRLQAEVSALRQQVRRTEASAANAALPSAQGAVTVPGSGHSSKAKDLAEPFEARLRTEVPAADWAPDAQASLSELLRDDSFRDSSLSSIECRATVCKLVVEHATADAQGEFSDLFSAMAPQSQEVMTQPFGNAEDGFGTVAYLTRPGHPVTYTLSEALTNEAPLHIPAAFRAPPP